jgi:DNA-binding phage protein
MAKVKTRPHDAANTIETLDDAVFLLEAAFEDGDAQVIAEAIGAIARAHKDSDDLSEPDF